MIVRMIVGLEIGIGCVTNIYVGTKKASENQKWLQLTLLCSFFSMLLYYYEIQCEDIAALTINFNMRYILKAFTLVCYGQFLSKYCDVTIGRFANQIILYSAILMAVVLSTNPFHHLVYTAEGIGKDFVAVYLKLQPHFMYYLFIYGMALVMMLCDIMILIRMREYRAKETERKRLWWLLLCGMLPIAGLAVQKIMPQERLDFVSIFFGISQLILLILALNHGLLDALDVARSSILNNTKEGLIIVDTDYNVIYANPVVELHYPNIYKLSQEEQEFLHEIFQKKESVYKKKGIFCEIRVSSLYEGKHLKGYMAWIFDMSFINNYTKEILVLKDEAEKASQAKSAFLANMSHEIRTPMNAILGFAELILQQNGNPKITQEYARDIKRAAGNLLHIINEVLDISKIEAGRMEIEEKAYYTQSLLEDVSILIANQAEKKGLHYEMEVEADIPYQLKGAVGVIHEVLTNILNNAVKYTKEGSVILRVKEKERDQKKIKVLFEVEDTGMGMKEEDKKKLFDKFSQFDTKLNRKVEGTGLGMAIVKAFVERMDGEIYVESEYGKGTKISVLLEQEIVSAEPVGKFDLSQVEEKEVHDEFVSTAKVLVVDDNETNLRVTSGLLKKYEIFADTAESGRRSIEMILQDPYDLIFMDHMMPEMDGVEAMQQIKKMADGKYKQIPVVALTANAIAGVREQMLSAGFQDYLTKPIHIEELESVLLRNLSEDKIRFVGHKDETEPNGENVEDLQKVMREIDIQQGIHNCGGTKEEYLQVLEVVERHGKQRIQKLQEMMQQEDFENYTINVHALKSTAANIGAMELSKVAYEQEMNGKNGRYEQLKERHQHLMVLYMNLLDGIEQVQKMQEDIPVFAGELEKETEEGTDELQDTLTWTEMQELVEEICQMVEQFEFEKAQEILRETEQFPLEPQIADGLKQTLKRLDDLDMEGGLEELYALKEICREAKKD